MPDTSNCLHRIDIDPIKFVAKPVLPKGYVVNPDANEGKILRSISFDIQDFFIDYDVVTYKVKSQFIGPTKPENLTEIECDSEFYEFFLNGTLHYNAIIYNLIPISSKGVADAKLSVITATEDIPLRLKIAFACPGCVNPRDIHDVLGKDYFNFTLKGAPQAITVINSDGVLVENDIKTAPDNDFYRLLNNHTVEQTILLPYILTITPKVIIPDTDPTPEPVQP